jgi:hypothetical protein
MNDVFSWIIPDLKTSQTSPADGQTLQEKEKSGEQQKARTRAEKDFSPPVSSPLPDARSATPRRSI